jgi:Tfp pilus assembly protein PilF
MSVLLKALKAAERDKERRASDAARSVLQPVHVPLRSRPQSQWSGQRVMAYSAFGLVVVTMAVVALVAWPRKNSLPDVPPLTSTILSEALAADSARRVARPAPASASSAGPVNRNAPDNAISRTVEAPAASSPSTSIAREPAAIPQGQARVVASQAPSLTDASDSVSPGRLRVSVERSGQPEAARLFADAVAAQRAGDVAAARRLYERLLLVTPRDADALNNLAILLSSQRDYSGAQELLRRAASAAPRNAGVWNNIGTVFREQGKSSDAIAAFRHALTIDPRHPGAQVGLAQQYLAISQLDDARDLLLEVVASNPQLPEAHYTLGQVLERQGDRQRAIQAYEAFIKYAPPRLAEHADLVRRRVEALVRSR